MKKTFKLIALCVLCMLFTWSCQMDNNEDDMRNELISSNLLKDGDINSASLIGEWDCVKFAYTTDGNKISNVSDISKGGLTIPYAPTPIEQNLEDRWELYHSNSTWFICSLNGNLIKLELKGSTLVGSPPEESNIVEALRNVYSFVVKDNELIFYFTGDEDKNLLILKNDKL